MILFLLFSLFICISNATNTNENDECFNIKENYVLNQKTTLQIKGNGRMCDCNSNELK